MCQIHEGGVHADNINGDREQCRMYFRMMLERCVRDSSSIAQLY